MSLNILRDDDPDDNEDELFVAVTRDNRQVMNAVIRKHQTDSYKASTYL